MAFDVQGALKAGYTPEEIGRHVGFDVVGAKAAGYSDDEIVGHLSGGVAKSPSFMDRNKANFDKRIENAAKINNNPNMTGAEKVIGNVGQGWGMAADIPMDIIGMGINAIPQSIKSAVTEAPMSFLGGRSLKQTGEAFAPVIGAIGQGYSKLEEVAPRVTNPINAVGNAANLAGLMAGGVGNPKYNAFKVGESPTINAIKEGVNITKDVASLVKVPGSKFIPKATRSVLGAVTGEGEQNIINSIRGGEKFTKAMRGQITGEEIVETARQGLQTLKDKRAAAYQGTLATISENGMILDKTPIDIHLDELMKRYNAKILPDGTIDATKVAMGKAGRNDIAEVISTVKTWDDFTPSGLDTLKRQLGDFYSDSSQARQFVASIEDKVKNVIVKDVPEYAEMTKGYAEATSLIKDIESGLMMKKNGMSGRITADQTLRRLTSSMKQNFALRKDLVDALGVEGNADLGAMISGHSMSSIVPKELAARLLAGGTGAATILHMVNPSMLPLLAASSPRVMGEFLNVYGKVKRTLSFGEKTPGFKSVAGKKLERYVSGGLELSQ